MKNFIRNVSRLFKRKKYVELPDYDDFNEPLFDVGDRVIIVNPNLVDPPDEPPIANIISAVVYLPELDKYVYRLEGSPFYFNENWLQADLFGPMTLNVVMEDSPEIIDTWLEIYEWNRRMLERTGDESYREKLESIEERLKAITAENNC